MQKLILIIAVLFSTLVTKANEEPKLLTAQKIDAKTIQLTAVLNTQVGDTYEIQKSYDNKTFSTIAVVMNSEDEVNLPSISLKDKVGKNKRVYYRVVSVKNNTIEASTTQTVQ